MYIMESIHHSFGGFTLDTASISRTSTSKTKIVLPYTGQLPAELNDATGAAIVITLQVGLTVNVLLTIERAGKEFRYPVKATPEEIDHILEPYTLGLYQGSYINWERLTLDAYGLDNLLPQLSPAAVEQVLQHIKHSQIRHRKSKIKRDPVVHHRISFRRSL